MFNAQEKLSEQELADAFDDFLNENYGSFEMNGFHFWASNIMKMTDPIMYRVSLTDYANMLIEDGYQIDGY